MMEWNKNNTFFFIQLVRERPVLWDPASPDRKDKMKKLDALLEIAKIVGITKDEVNTKWISLKGQYNRERKKVMGFQTGSPSDKIYRSKWFAYHEMSSLVPNNIPQDPLNNFEYDQTMVRYKSKGIRGNWSEASMKQALTAIKSGKMKIYGAAKHYNIPRRTLRRYLLEEKETKSTLGRKPLLKPEQKKISASRTIRSSTQRVLRRRDTQTFTSIPDMPSQSQAILTAPQSMRTQLSASPTRHLTTPTPSQITSSPPPNTTSPTPMPPLIRARIWSGPSRNSGLYSEALPTLKVIKERRSQPPEADDDVTAFGLYIAAQMRKFKPVHQSKLKLEIQTLIHKYELKNIKANNRSTSSASDDLSE